MFGLFKSNPKDKLQKEYEKLLEEGMHLQRNGDIKGYSTITAEAEKLREKIEQLESNESGSS
ncbi:MAG: putative transcriptional regulator [Cellvibrionaceae bacterium]|jgi:predicted transcriptional regulator